MTGAKLISEQISDRIHKAFADGKTEVQAALNELREAIEPDLQSIEQLQSQLTIAQQALLNAGFTPCVGPAKWKPPVNSKAGELRRRLYDTEDKLSESRATVALMLTQNAALQDDLSNFRQFGRALEDVIAERFRQNEKWGEQNYGDFTFLAILVEEVGEFAKAALHLQFGGPEAAHTREEMIHCAAVALQIVEAIDRRTAQAESWRTESEAAK